MQHSSEKEDQKTNLICTTILNKHRKITEYKLRIEDIKLTDV
jgi:hypothetical protein